MNVIFHTLGCKVNQYESQAIRELFLSAGYKSDNTKKADVIVINSCTVTAESDRKTRQLVRKYRKDNKDAVIILTGCMVQAFPEKAKELSEADIILGNKDFSHIVSLTEKFLTTKSKIFSYDKHLNKEKYNTSFITDFYDRTRAYMKIEDGCDRFCSYCIIPFARGRVRSRSLTEIKAEAETLAKKGFSEVVLVGINLSAYGKDETFNICDAVDVVASVNEIKRVRLGSLEPDHITDEMLLRLKNNQKFCPQFHLSLQSGCDETLKRMNRHYDSEFYYDLVKRINKTFDNASITTDVMVGFTGETEEEFAKSLNFVKKVRFARTHIFPYSRREGTFAFNLDGQLDNAVKTHRAKLMNDTAKECEKSFLKSQVGKRVEVLFETPEKDYAVGYSENYTLIKVKTKDNLCGKILKVKILNAYDNYCVGELV